MNGYEISVTLKK